MILHVLVGEGELLIGHIDAYDEALLAHKLRQHETVAARAATKVEDARALHDLGEHEAAAIVGGDGISVKQGQRLHHGLARLRWGNT